MRPPEPAHLKGVPRLYNARKPFRDLPSFAMSEPGVTAFDWRRAMALSLRRRCGTCGCRLGDTVWTVWFSDGSGCPRVGGDREEFRLWHPGDVFTDRTRTPGPQHLSCALYAIGVCPVLAHPLSSAPSDRTRRRGNAAVFGFGKFGISFFDDDQVAYGYAEQVKCVEYRTFADVAEWYKQALKDDARIDTSTRLYWEPPYGPQQLAVCASADKGCLARMRQTAYYKAHTGHAYRLAVIH